MIRLALGVLAGGILVSAALPLGAQNSTGTWASSAYLKAADAEEDAELAAGDALSGVGLAMSRDGATLIVGAKGQGEAGAAYVFTRSGAGWAQQAHLKASNPDKGDQFGFAVAVSGDGNTIAVSANFEDSAASGVNGNQADNSAEAAGAVYVFTRSGAAWAQQAYLKASNAQEDDRFGYSLALSHDGSTLAVGAIGEDSAARGLNGNQADDSASQAGAVYLFTRAGTAWSQQAYLKASNTGGGDMFGFCVAMSADARTLAVCGYDEDSSAQGVNGDQESNASGGSGAAYVFVRDGAAWTQQAYLKQSNTTLQSAFGSSIVISADGSTLAVCAVDEDAITTGVNAAQWQADRRPEDRTRIVEGSAGAVYVFTRTGSTWAQQAYLKSSNMRLFDQFGMRMALSDDGNVFAASAPLQPGGGQGVNPGRNDDASPESGAVYVFRRRGGQWAQEAHVKAPNAQEYDMFGSGVALSGNGASLAVAASGEDGGRGAAGNQGDNSLRDSGAIYIFTRSPQS